MPLQLITTDNEPKIELDVVEFVEEGDSRYFRVSSSHSTEWSVDINYVPFLPDWETSWDKEKYELYLMENPYLNAENDVFEVREESLEEERLGWIFPITILESNDNDYSNYKNLNKYKYIAYQKLLEQNKRIERHSINNDNPLKLAEIFEDHIVCILCKETINKIEEFSFDDYLLTLYSYNYLLIDETCKAKRIYSRDDLLQKMRAADSRKVKLKKSKFPISDNKFIKALFKGHLLQSDEPIARFILLYQIIEFFKEIEHEHLFSKSLKEYNERRIRRQDLKEIITRKLADRLLIIKIFDRVSIEPELKKTFIDECNLMLGNPSDHQVNLPDQIYNMRNLIVHNLPLLTENPKSLLNMVGIFEQVIVNLLVEYSHP